MVEEEYRTFRRRAIPAIARSVLRDPAVDRDTGPGGTGGSSAGGSGRDGDADGSGRGDAGGSGSGGDGGGSGEVDRPDSDRRDVVVRLHPAVRDYLADEFEDAFRGVDPRDLAATVPVETPDPDTSASVPLADGREDGLERGRLLAYRTVRADLLSALADDAEELATALEVHDALQRLVGERGGPTDRRPTEVVASFLAWIADRRDEATAEALREEFTVLHVMRVAPLYTARDDGLHELTVALREWLTEAHPEVLEGRSVTVTR